MGKRPMNAWAKKVKEVYDREKRKHPNFKLKDAMKMAKKEYVKTKKGGDGEMAPAMSSRSRSRARSRARGRTRARARA